MLRDTRTWYFAPAAWLFPCPESGASAFTVTVLIPGCKSSPCTACRPVDVSTTGYSVAPTDTCKNGIVDQSVAGSTTRFSRFPTAALCGGYRIVSVGVSGDGSAEEETATIDTAIA